MTNDDKVLDTSIGTISFLGYLPDVLMPLLVSLLASRFGANGYYAPFVL